MERVRDPDDIVHDVRRRSPEPDGQCLSVGASRPQGSSGTLIPNEIFEANTIPERTDAYNHRIHLEASYRSLHFQVKQYLVYVSKVRAAGIEPKDLLTSLEIANSGPNAAPADFWCLLAVRDRLRTVLEALYSEIKEENEQARRSLRDSFNFSLSLAGGSAVSVTALLPKAWALTRAIVTAVPTLASNAREGGKALTAEWYGRALESIGQRAMNWDLDDGDRRYLESVAGWFRMVS